MAQTAAQICTLARQIAKCPGYTSQSGQLLNVILEELAQWGQVLAAYRTAQWEQAQSPLQALLAVQPHKTLYLLYAQRLAHFQVQSPPAGWDGATRING